jgi:phosphoribosylformylglycinamidine synthase PurS subunit
VSTFRVRVRIMPRAGILDPQGQAVEHALGSLGFAGVGGVRVGRSIELRVEAGREAEARDSAGRMCERLLANPVTEDFTVDAVEPDA